jgi:hypothetical protein
MERAADELMHAYMGVDDEAWLDEDPKYLDFLATVAQGIKNQPFNLFCGYPRKNGCLQLP